MAETSTSSASSSAGVHGEFPSIDPSSFDLVIAGTGLPASLIAAAAAAIGRSVLHVDANPFYGSHFSSLSPQSLPSFLIPPPEPALEHSDSPSLAAVGLLPRRIYSEVEIAGSLPSEAAKGCLLDLAGPRVLYCADRAVDFLLRSGASHHVEFKSVDASLIYWEGRLCPVPDSRQAIFRDRTLSLAEKREMMRFLKLVQSHIGSSSGGETAAPAEDGEAAVAGILAEDLEIPLAEFLKKQRLPPKIRSIILYAITLANYDQENGESGKKLIKTREGIESLALYMSSIGRFPNAVGAFIYPIYGHGELPQAFCRCAAVKGALYVLRMPVVAVLIDEETRQYRGVRLASGQDIFSQQLVVDTLYTVPSLISPPEKDLNSSTLSEKVARGICVTDRSIQHDSSNIMVVFPSRTLNPGQLTTVRALQLSSNVAVCPPGLFVVYLSISCEDAIQGKENIRAAMNALFIKSESSDGSKPESSDSSTSPSKEGIEGESKPILIWSAVYVQDLIQASSGAVCSCPTPDDNLDYRNLLESTFELFTKMYPEQEFFPDKPASENDEDDDNSFE